MCYRHLPVLRIDDLFLKILAVIVISGVAACPGLLFAGEKMEEEMVFIPAGDFIMGEGPSEGREGVDYGVDEEPRHKRHLDSFYIDRYEITIGQFREFLKATGRTWDAEPLLLKQYPEDISSNPSALSKYPVNFMEWSDADAYCRWRGKRLPTEEEWEKAARGTKGLRHPWGDHFDPKRANVVERLIGHPTPVGSFPDDKSPFGLFDVAGNLSEWTSSHYLPYPGSRFSSTPGWTTDAYVLKGGSFHLPGKLYGRPSVRSLAYPAYSHYMFGFRCAKDAP